MTDRTNVRRGSEAQEQDNSDRSADSPHQGFPASDQVTSDLRFSKEHDRGLTKSAEVLGIFEQLECHGVGRQIGRKIDNFSVSQRRPIVRLIYNSKRRWQRV